MFRLHGDPRVGADEQLRGVVVYVPASSTTAMVASQLPGAADHLEQRRR